MKKLVLFFLLALLATVSAGEVAKKVDLNTATYDQILELPITEAQAKSICEYRTYISFFESVYDLKDVAGIDQETINRLKPLIRISHYSNQDEAAERREEIYYLIQRLGSNEGTQEGLGDIWEDYLMTPQNINKLHYSEILNLPNTSPLDVAAVLRRRAEGDTLSSFRDLRQTPGISYYGASNIKHYVYYNKPQENRLYFDYQFKFNNSVYEEAALEMYTNGMVRDADNPDDFPRDKANSFLGQLDVSEQDAAFMNKLRIRYGNMLKFGLIYNSNKGETTPSESSPADVIEDGKYFVSYENEIITNNNLKVIAGNYRATFGEGLVMENTDYYSSRKTGYGFSKRITGVIGDVSRTQEYALKGAAIQWSNDSFSATAFTSYDKKDAVIWDSNFNGEIDSEDAAFSYITMSSRFDNNDLEAAEYFFNTNEYNTSQIDIAPRLDAVTETLYGTHLDYTPLVGTHLGFTGYTANYSREFLVPDEAGLGELLFYNLDEFDKKWKSPDAEINAMYSGDERTVLGFDWRTVLSNTSFQGEYAEMNVDGESLKIGDDPSALLLSTYTQFDNLYIIGIFRDYDIDFDNPYARGFSEHEKYDDTVFDKYGYVLDNVLLSDLYINSAQAAAEKGIYLETRYRFSTKFTLNRTYLDIFERKSDRRKTVRFQGDLYYQPIFPLRVQFKQKYQANRYDDDADRSASYTSETTVGIRANLSNRDQLGFSIMYAQTDVPPYPYLSNDPTPDGSDNSVAALTAMKANALFVDYTHNLNKNIKLQGSVVYWSSEEGSIWDWEDMEIDFMGENGVKYWFALQNRISDNLFLSIKVKVKHYKTREYEWRAWWNEPVEEDGYFARVDKKENTLRLQLDWKF